MIPLRLTVQGLYSYKEPQTIDFETLAGSQLFGIFGAVGSGKSSILEAVVFALYDRSERLNKSDNRYYNMLNLQSQQFAIDFIFRVTSPQRTKYRFTVSARRKKKDYEKVEVKERRQYRWENNGWLPIEGPDAASIIGMTYENFMQTVIIPQGKFREFIDQKPNDRTQMLKELFRLEKFDLSHKTNHLLAATPLGHHRPGSPRVGDRPGECRGDRRDAAGDAGGGGFLAAECRVAPGNGSRLRKL